MKRFWDRDQSGQAIVLVALILLVLFMFTGLAVDAGQLFSARRTMQEAADSAAYAGAVVIYQGGTHSALGVCGLSTTDQTSQAYQAAVADGTTNGFTDGVAGNIVTINTPPLSGTYCGNNNYVEVIIRASVRTTLVPAEAGLTTVQVRGVAGAEPLNNGYAIMALDRGNTPSAFTDSSTADIHLSGGGILVNSTSTTAATNSQTSCSRFTIQTPYDITIAGGTTSAWPNCPPPNDFAEATNQAQVPDPLAGQPKPNTAGLPLCSALNSPGCQDGSGNQNPGIYTVTLGGSGHTAMTLNPGIFILEAGVNESGNADIHSLNDSSCQGPPNMCGVFIFNTKTNYPNSGAGDTCGPVNLSGNGSSNLNAVVGRPRTDPMYAYNNFMFYQDSNCTAAMTISGNGSITGSGTVYLPSAAFRFNGNNATLTGSQLVALTVDIQNGNINIDFNGGNTAQPILPRLSE